MKILILFFMVVSLYASTQEALQAYKDKEYTKAFALYSEAAKKGNAEAQNALSYLYFNGIGTSQDQQQGFMWLKKAADSNDTRACFDLGMMYLMGVHTQKDLQKAAKYLQIASNKGNLEATYNLALMYYRGDGVKQDVNKAASLLDKAAKAGHSGSRRNVGRVYMQVLNFKKAKEWLRVNAQEGDVEAAQLLKEIEAAKKD